MDSFLVRLTLFLLTVLLAACGSGGSSLPTDIVFQDQFVPGESGEWLLEGDDVGRTAVIDQQLVISVNQPNTMQYAALAEPLFTNFSLEVEARQIAGNPESSYGLLVRLLESGQFYRFDITSSGQYMVERYNADGAWSQYLDDWTASPAINQGLNTVNRLKVIANGPALSFYVNDTLLHETFDNSAAPGAIALDAGSFGYGGLQVAFDNVVVRELPGANGE
ncbi:MAG: hypothetical protein R6X34_16055 [Chloroflexota bacterium]